MYKTHIPSAPLNRYVAHFTYYKEQNHPYAAMRILPDGCVQLLIALDEAPRAFYKDGKCIFTCKNIFLAGVQQSYLHADATGYGVLAIKFRAGGSYPFLQLPLPELNDLYVDAEDILGRSTLILREQLLVLDEPDKMFHLVEKFLMRRLTPEKQPQQTVDAAIAHINNPFQPLQVRQLSETLGYSQKQFIHIFKRHVGVSPKYYQRIARFNRVLNKVDPAQPVNWSSIGQACGFYDQAHLINEFKFFAGISPTTYLPQKGQVPYLLPIVQKT